jgi:hypothetical protein
MPRTRCPACGSIFGEWLEEVSKSGSVDHYRCQTCAHSWNAPKEDPDGAPHVKPLRAKSDSNSQDDHLAQNFKSASAIGTEQSLHTKATAGGDRPISQWVKLRVECVTSDGAVLWAEEAQAGGLKERRAGGVKSAMEKLTIQLAKRISQTPLPKEE